MHKILTIINFIFFTNCLMAQSSGWRVLGGVKISSRWQTQPYAQIHIDSYSQIEETEPIALSTFSVIYSHEINSKWDWSIGMNFNKKGFKEIGTFHDFPPSVTAFKTNRIRDYIGGLMGARYNFYQKNTWKIYSEIFFNPEIEKSSYQDVKKFAVSSIVLLNIEKQIISHLTIALNPFFETSLMNYNKTSNYNTFQYSPYGYGLTVGFKYSR